MTKDKELRKSLKGPDEFQKTVASGLSWFLKFKKTLVASLTAVALIAIAIPVLRWINERKAAGLQGDLSKVELKYDEEEKSAEDKREAIRKQIAELEKPAVVSDPSKPKAQPIDEKKKAELEANLKKISADHSGSLAAYQDFFSKHEGSPAGWMAGFRAVSILLEQKKYAETEEILTKVISKSAGFNFYQIQGRLTLVNVYEELGQYDKALQTNEELLSVSDKDLKPQILLTKGRLELSKNNKEAATKTLDALIKDFGKSAEADKARSMKAVLLN